MQKHQQQQQQQQEERYPQINYSVIVFYFADIFLLAAAVVDVFAYARGLFIHLKKLLDSDWLKRSEVFK